MDEIKKMKVEDFEKQPDGSWVCLKPTDIITLTGIIRVGPGFTFKQGIKLWELDVPKVLDQMSAN